MHEVFEFSREFVAEDVVVRTAEVDGPRSVDVLVTAAGRKALWNFEGFLSAEEAMTWLAKTTA